MTLDGPAPAGGTLVTITESHPAATFPATVLVPEGQTGRTFNYTISAVDARLTAPVNASAGGVTLTRELTVRPIRASTLSLSPSRLRGGGSAVGTVTLECGAAPGNVTVALSSSAPGAAVVPASVMVPAGAKSATFSVTTLPVTASKTVTIKATAGGVTVSSSLVVDP